MLSFFPRGVLDEILNLIESVSGGFPSYSYLSYLGLDLILFFAWSFGFNWRFTFAPVFQWYCVTPWGSPVITIGFCRVPISDSS